MASRAFHPDRFTGQQQTGSPAAEVNPFMAAMMADCKAAGELHARLVATGEYEHRLSGAWKWLVLQPHRGPALPVHRQGCVHFCLSAGIPGWSHQPGPQSHDTGMRGSLPW